MDRLIAARDLERLTVVASDLGQYGGRVAPMKTDVAQIKDAEAMVRSGAGKIINIASMYGINAPAASLRAARDFSELDRSGRYPD